MSGTFAPCLDILPSPQRRLWSELATLPPQFTLYGGTAIALRLGHRASVDFDFFGSIALDPNQLLSELDFLDGAQVLDIQPGSLTVTIDRDGPVKLSFFGVPKLGRVREPACADDIGLAVADLLDLGATKVSVVQRRAEAKDYIDVDALLLAGLPLPDILAAADAIYGPAFSAQSALKALAYFDDDTLAGLTPELQARLRRAVREVNLDQLPAVPPLRGKT